MPPESAPQLTQQARAGVRRVPWRTVLAGASGASVVALLAVSGLGPLVSAVAAGALSLTAVQDWLANLGANALSGWLAEWATQATQKALSDEQRAAELEQRAVADPTLAAALATLLAKIDAVPQSLDALQDEVGAQSDLLLAQHDLLARLSADVERLGLAGGALGPALIAEADRVITALESRADRTDTRLEAILAELRVLRDTQRQAVISFAGPTGDVSIGDVAGRDLNKNQGDVIYGTKVVQEAFTPRSVAATPGELATATERLAALPTDAAPAPQDVLPPGSWMGSLRRNEQFVGREADLLALATLLKGGETVAVNQAQSAVASGLGGIGKTQLAIEVAYRYGQHFAGVFWLSFAQPGAIPAEIARCGGAAHLQLFTEAAGLSLDEQAALVRARWACGLPYLLIFDNCEDPDLVRAYHPGGATRVLITSRTPDWPGELGVRRHPLGVLNREESIALLRQHRPDLSNADADALANELGDLPLALHLAGRFLAGPGKILSVARYLTELRSSRIFERLPLRERDGTLPTGHSRDVARTFALSYERLDPQDAEDALALRLLARAAYLVPGEVIPTDLLRATLEGDQDDLGTQLATESALERLVGLGLLEREAEDGLRMHRLVGAYVRQVSDEATAQETVERAVLGVAQDLSDAPTLAPIAAFQPILRGVTDAALPREDAGAATLCIWLGRHLDRLGAYAPAQPYLERALALRERVLGPGHPDTASSLNNLAGLLERQGNYEAARPLYERALALREHVLGPDHLDTATSLNNLADLHQRQGNYESSRSLFERALALRERVLGPEHPDTASSLGNLAGLLESQGNYEAARPLFERALLLHERVLGPEHPDTATSLGKLAGLLESQGNYEAARPLFERALAISERVLGPEHPNTASHLNNLAVLYRAQGNYAAALPLYERALAINERRLGSEHPQTASSLNNLARLLESQGDYEAARPLYERALALRERVLGPEHPDTASSLNNLASFYQSHGNYAAARPLYERALAVRERALGAEHPQTALSLNNLAINHYYQDDLLVAERLMRRALQILEARLGSDHPHTQISHRGLAAIQQRLGGSSPQPPTDPTKALAPLLAAIAAITTGDEAQRPAVEQALARLEQQGWMLRGPVERIWAGERDHQALVAGLDDQDTALITRVLELIGEQEVPPAS